jgi:RimJ/RimL family protein N-acetyltransferase
MSFSIELELQQFPKHVRLKENKRAILRPLEKTDEKEFHNLFLGIPEQERMFIKHRVTDIEVIQAWCKNIDYGRNLPIVALVGGRIVGVATLHQQLGGWKRHIGRISVLVHPEFRGRGIGKTLVELTIDIARQASLEKVEAEFIGEQETAIRMFAMLGFSHLVELEEYVKDMQAVAHDYILMGMELKTDEEYAGVGG